MKDYFENRLVVCEGCSGYSQHESNSCARCHGKRYTDLVEEWRTERAPWRRLAAQISLVILAAVALAMVTVIIARIAGAADQPVLEGRADIGNGGSVSLYRAPCEGAARAMVLAMVPPQYQEGWQRADGVFFMRDTEKLKAFAGCWLYPPVELTGGEEAVLLVWEDGDRHLLRRSVFAARVKGTRI